MSYDVQLSGLAIEDLIELHQWVSAETDIPTADGYLARIEKRIAALADFPRRGSPRDDLIAGPRTLTFECRLLIAYSPFDFSHAALPLSTPLILSSVPQASKSNRISSVHEIAHRRRSIVTGCGRCANDCALQKACRARMRQRNAIAKFRLTRGNSRRPDARTCRAVH